MMTMKLDLKDWVKIDRTYASQQKEKERLIKTLRDKVFVSNNDESTVLAKRELLETLIEYLPGEVINHGSLWFTNICAHHPPS